MNDVRFLRRNEAADYLRNRYGFGSAKTLAKLATIGGGPQYHKAGQTIVLYTQDHLDEWALAKIGAAQRTTSEVAA